jgi:hypothetical protein
MSATDAQSAAVQTHVRQLLSALTPENMEQSRSLFRQAVSEHGANVLALMFSDVFRLIIDRRSPPIISEFARGELHHFSSSTLIFSSLCTAVEGLLQPSPERPTAVQAHTLLSAVHTALSLSANEYIIMSHAFVVSQHQELYLAGQSGLSSVLSSLDTHTVQQLSDNAIICVLYYVHGIQTSPHYASEAQRVKQLILRRYQAENSMPAAVQNFLLSVGGAHSVPDVRAAAQASHSAYTYGSDAVQTAQQNSGDTVATLFFHVGPALTAHSLILDDLFGTVRLTAAQLGMVLAAMVMNSQAPPHSVEATVLQTRLAAVGLSGAVAVMRQDPSAAALLPLTAPVQWDLGLLAAALRRHCPDMDWAAVVRGLDQPSFALQSRSSMYLLLRIFQLVNPGAAFPIAGLFGPWQHMAAQLSILLNCTLVTLEAAQASAGQQSLDEASVQAASCLDWSLSPRYLPALDVQRQVPTSQQPAMNAMNSIWRSVDLVEALFAISGASGPSPSDALTNQVDAHLTQYPLRSVPEQLLASMARVSSARVDEAGGNRFFWHWFGRLVVLFIPKTHPSSGIVLATLAQHSPAMLSRALVKAYQAEPNAIPRILEIVVTLRQLPTVLEARPIAFSLDLAVSAASAGILDLARYLNGQILRHGPSFIEASLEFAALKLHKDAAALGKPIPAALDPEGARHLSSSPMPAELHATLVRVLFSHSGLAPRDGADKLNGHAVAVAHVYENFDMLLRDAAQANSALGSAAKNLFDAVFKTQALSVAQFVQRMTDLRLSRRPVDRLLLRRIITDFLHVFSEPTPRLPTVQTLGGALLAELFSRNLLLGTTLGAAASLVLTRLNASEPAAVAFAIPAVQALVAPTVGPDGRSAPCISAPWNEFRNALLRTRGVASHPKLMAALSRSFPATPVTPGAVSVDAGGLLDPSELVPEPPVTDTDITGHPSLSLAYP